MRSRATSASWPDYVLGGSIGVLTLLAWLALWLWGKSPSGHMLMHGSAQGAFTGIFILGWTLMTVAMMLPTAVPLLVMFRRMVAGTGDSASLVTLLIAGYLGVWIVFGVVAQSANRLAAQALQAIGTPWIAGAAILLIAGIYQFTPLKYACLEKCQTPRSFIISRWRGGNRQWQSLRIGIEHGIFCVGCCWSLMLLMFLVGAGSLGWMFLLGAVMALEKNFPFGKRMSAPVGVILIAAAGFVTYQGLAA